MRKLISLLLAAALLPCFPVLSSAENSPEFTLTVNAADLPQAVFAREEIESAAEKTELTSDWIVELSSIEKSLGAETYRIEISDHTVTVTGGDASGLMYGGLEVAEQLALYGAEGIQPCTASPRVLHRGYMYNVPMDMRTPAYNSPGTSGQNNIENMWDISFWQELLDDMARNRFNLILFENINPYPSMVRVEGYEDIALDDVWRTTIPYDNTARGDCTNLVQDINWNNYEVVKKIPIDEKIAFWQHVMTMAKERGIEFHIKHSNIYPFVEEGRYGITDDPANPVTQDYYYRSCKALLETYPDLKGLFLTPGENMGWSNESDAKAKNIQWLHDVFGRAVNEVLAEDPEREFFYSVNMAGSEDFAAIHSDLRAEVLYTAQYASTHMYASSTPHTADAALAMLPEGSRSWLAFRNEDCFDMRWGDSDFMRDFIGGMPEQNILFGFITGSDGYCYGREYSFTDPELKGQLYTKKHWFNFFLIGRLAFDPELDARRIQDVFMAHYGSAPGAELLYTTTLTAGKVIPQVNKIYYQSNGDYTWYVAGCWSHPSTAGYIDLKKWMKNDNTYIDNMTMSIEEYSLLAAAGKPMPEDGRMLPTEVSENLRTYAESVLSNSEQLRAGLTGDGSFARKEFFCLIQDNEAMAYLGLFYAEKILGAIDIRLLNETEDEKYRESSIAHLEQSAAYFDQYAAIISANYEPQQLSRVGHYNILEIAQEVHKDVDIAKKWKHRTLRPSFRAPDKEDYMNKNP